MTAFWPTGSTEQPYLSDFYGPRPPINGSRPFHYGVDVPMGLGAEVHAAQAGIVVFSGTNGTLGEQVVIDTGTYQFLYPHMEYGSRIARGARVLPNAAVGRVGLTGNTSGPHVCFRVFQGNWWDDAKARNPIEIMAALNAAAPASLPPTPLPPIRKKRLMFSFIRNKTTGEIAIIDASKATYRRLSLGEWLGWSAAGAKYADLTPSQYDSALGALAAS